MLARCIPATFLLLASCFTNVLHACWVFVAMKRERERERERERQTETERDRDRDRETETDRDRQRQTDRETGRQTDRQTESVCLNVLVCMRVGRGPEKETDIDIWKERVQITGQLCY